MKSLLLKTLSIIFITLILISFINFPGTQVNAGVNNLIVNGYFELDPSGNGTWLTYVNNGTANFSWDHMTFHGSSGSSIMINGNSTFAALANKISIQTNTKYFFNVWGKASNVIAGTDQDGAAIYCEQYDSSGNYIQGTGKMFSDIGTFDWAAAPYSFISEPNAAYFIIILALDGSGTVWYDDASLVQMTSVDITNTQTPTPSPTTEFNTIPFETSTPMISPTPTQTPEITPVPTPTPSPVSTPLAPAKFAAASNGADKVLLSWTASVDASGYEIYRSTSTTFTSTPLVSVGLFTNYIDSSLTAVTTYYYKILSYKMIGTIRIKSDYSAVASVKPIPSAPEKPKAVSASYSSIYLNWQAVSGVDGYTIYRSSSSTGAYINIATTNNKYYTDSSLVINKIYYYKIVAYRFVGKTMVYGNYSIVVYAKPIPSTPKATAARLSSSSIKISWGAIIGTTKYEVYRSTSVSGQYTLKKATSNTAYIDTGLTKGNTYYYKIRSYRIVGTTKIYGNFSTVVFAKP